MFGVDFQEQVEHYKSQVPPIITKCLAEIERRGVMIKVWILRALLWCVPFTMNTPMQISCACILLLVSACDGTCFVVTACASGFIIIFELA